MKKLILTILAAGWAAFAFAQEGTPATNDDGYQTSGFFEGGFWQVLKNPASAKFQEYRRVEEHMLLNRFGFDLTKGNYYLVVSANELGKTDQRAKASFGLVRKWKNEVTWSQTPHLYSNSTKMFYLNAGGGVFTLPDSIQAALTGTAPADTARITQRLKSYLSGAQPFDLSAQRNTGGATSEWKPRADVTVKAGYVNERKQGGKQFGTAIGFSAVELPEPLNYETHRFSASAELARKKYSAAVEYNGRIFNNKTETLIRDNAFRLTDVAGTPSRIRMALYPDNTAHNFTFTGTYNLPYKTRSVAVVSYGIAEQNEPFLPHTINSAISDTGLVIRRLEDGTIVTSLDGKFKTLLLNYQISSRPMEKLTLKGKARFYDFKNETPELFFSNFVNYDATVVTRGRINLPYGYDKTSGGAEAGYEIIPQAHAGVGYTRERVNREHREVEASNEDIYTGTLDLRPADWATVRSSYVHSERKTDKYEPDFFEESFPEGEAVTNVAMSLDELRRFDVYNRKRDRVELTSQLSPIDQLDVGLNVSFAQDDYSAAYGLQKFWNLGWGVDFTYTPVPRLTLFGEVGREGNRGETESRYRPVVANVGLDSLNNDWSGMLRDRFDNYGFGFSADVWPKKLVWGANYGFSYSKSELLATFAPGGVVSGNAVDYPAVYYKLHRVGSQLSYRIASQTSIKFDYWYEKYLETDWAIDFLEPFMAVSNRSIFLGFRVPEYEAHVMALKLSYAF